jgi:undecaprenyl pyrophosphate phosphatase UppP
MSIDRVHQRQNRLNWWFNIIASLLILVVGGYLLYAAHSGWFGTRSPRMNFIAWLVVIYGVVRFLLYLRRHRGA